MEGKKLANGRVEQVSPRQKKEKRREIDGSLGTVSAPGEDVSVCVYSRLCFELRWRNSDMSGR